MGWRNMFIKIKNNEDENDGSSIERILEFVYHHNNWYEFFTKKEIKKIIKNDEIPGEELNIDVIINETEQKKEYWAYLGNHGGSTWSENWAEKYFSDLKIYNSSTFEYWGKGWIDWKLISTDEYKTLFDNVKLN